MPQPSAKTYVLSILRARWFFGAGGALHNISAEDTYPRKSKVSVFVPARMALAKASRPNATSRVFSGWRVSPYLANLLGGDFLPFSKHFFGFPMRG